MHNLVCKAIYACAGSFFFSFFTYYSMYLEWGRTAYFWTEIFQIISFPEILMKFRMHIIRSLFKQWKILMPHLLVMKINDVIRKLELWKQFQVFVLHSKHICFNLHKQGSPAYLYTFQKHCSKQIWYDWNSSKVNDKMWI